MQRIIDTTAVATLPATPALTGTAGYFTEGNPGTQPATLLRGWWVNMVQEELISILTAAGIAQDTTGLVFTQLLASMRKLFGGTPGSLAANGYMTLPGGLVMQWGTIVAANNAAVTFPIAFPIGALCVVANEGAASSGTWGAGLPTVHSTTPLSASQFTHWGLGWNGSTWISSSLTCSWIAIGH
jgi:hypothetical protein